MRDGQLESCDPYLLLGRLRRRFGANGEVECGELHFILSEQRLLFCDGRRLDAESEVEGGGFILTLERRKILPGERLGAESEVGFLLRVLEKLVLCGEIARRAILVEIARRFGLDAL